MSTKRYEKFFPKKHFSESKRRRKKKLDWDEIDKKMRKGELEAEELRDAIRKANGIYELEALLNYEDEYFRGSAVQDRGILDNLPTFGGTHPEDTLGIFSWDEDSYLIPDGDMGRWEVVPREELDDLD